jgi:hypothetical protein
MHAGIRCLVAITCLVLIACENPAEPARTGLVGASGDIDALLHPHQRELQRVLAITGVGIREGKWLGTFREADVVGGLEVETTSMTGGAGMHNVVQVWTLYPPDPFKRMRLVLVGSLDLATGELELSEATAHGQRVRVLAMLTSDGKESVSLEGFLMFAPGSADPST